MDTSNRQSRKFNKNNSNQRPRYSKKQWEEMKQAKQTARFERQYERARPMLEAKHNISQRHLHCMSTTALEELVPTLSGLDLRAAKHELERRSKKRAKTAQ